MAFFPLDMYPTYTEGYLNNEFHLYELGAVVSLHRCSETFVRLQHDVRQICNNSYLRRVLRPLQPMIPVYLNNSQPHQLACRLCFATLLLSGYNKLCGD